MKKAPYRKRLRSSSFDCRHGKSPSQLWRQYKQVPEIPSAVWLLEPMLFWELGRKRAKKPFPAAQRDIRKDLYFPECKAVFHWALSLLHKIGLWFALYIIYYAAIGWLSCVLSDILLPEAGNAALFFRRFPIDRIIHEWLRHGDDAGGTDQAPFGGYCGWYCS